MADVYLFEPTNIDAPQWSADQIEAIFGPINLYSFFSDQIWVGTGSYGQGIDFRYDGYGFLQGTQSGRVTGFTGYLNGNPSFSVDGFNVAVSSWVDFKPGLPLSQLGIFDGADNMNGSYGNDVLTGYKGSDDIWGNSGDDIIGAGNGPDQIWGDFGSDVMYGGFGRNTFKWEDDGAVDSLYIKSDQWAYNPVLGSTGNSPNGEKADVIYGLDSFDQVFIQGVSTDELSVYEIGGNIGIFARGALEALYTGGNLTVGQLQSMTFGVAA